MQTRPYCVVDVFTAEAYRGNPLAVVVDGSGLDTHQMQEFARWTRLSETVFLFPPTNAEADYQARIFTPAFEVPFAGHPTLGSCRVWLSNGGIPRSADEVIQQCGVGLVRLWRDGARLAFRAPQLQRSAVDEAVLGPVLGALGLARAKLVQAQWLDNGLRWLGLLLDSADTVLALEPDHPALKSLAMVGVIGPRDPRGPPSVVDFCAFEVRAFAAAADVPEDPVTGSLNAALAQWLIYDGLAPDCYVASQGTRLHRAGRVYIESRGGDIWVGGDSVICIAGTVLL